MLTVPAALDKLDHILSFARTAGADAADAHYSGDASTSIGVRLGKLEQVERAEGEEVTLRLFLGRRSAIVATSDLSASGMTAVVDRARAMAAEALEDPYSGLAPRDRLATAFPDLDLADADEVPAADLRAMALAAEDAARAVPGVSNSEGGGAQGGRATFALATSDGFRGGYTGTSAAVSASVIAGSGDGMERDYAYHSVRHRGDLEDAASIGRRAGERAVRRLGARQLPSGPLPVVFDPRVGNSLLGHLAGAITGSSIARGSSFLLGREGEQVFARGITIIDDPLRSRGLRSRPFDGEGPAPPRAR